VEESFSPSRMGSVVGALTEFVDTKLETSDELKSTQDDSVIVLSFAKGSKSHPRTVLLKLTDLGAASPREVGGEAAALGLSRQEESEEAQQTVVLDQAIAAATEVLHYINDAGLTPQTVLKAKITGARPFRKFVRRSCDGVPAESSFQCRKQKSEELLCGMMKVAGLKQKVQVELDATATGKTCSLPEDLGGLPAKIGAQAKAFPAAAALSQEGAKTVLAADASLETASRSEQELKATDASQAGFGIMHGLEKPEADEEWVQVDNLARSALKLLEEADTPDEWPSRVL